MQKDYAKKTLQLIDEVSHAMSRKRQRNEAIVDSRPLDRGVSGVIL
jgi:hypothetical protein